MVTKKYSIFTDIPSLYGYLEGGMEPERLEDGDLRGNHRLPRHWVTYVCGFKRRVIMITCSVRR